MVKHGFLDKDELRYKEFEKNFLLKKYAALLKTAKTEKQMQLFFEINPIFLPGLYDRHNGPLGNVVISKLHLANEYVTDFAFLSVDSARVQITLIEIESPSIKVFRESDNQYTSTFNKALQQLRDWALWIHANQSFIKDKFREIYFNNVFKYQYVTTKMILIAGRRQHIYRFSQREKRWAGLNSMIAPHEVLSYDHLTFGVVPNLYLLQNLICRPQHYIAHEMKRRFL
jgi:hypothetical protein